MRPRPYLSFSQMTTIEMSPEKYTSLYVYENQQRISRNMAYGSQMAEGLEAGEATGDPLLDLMMERIPKFSRMDKPVIAHKDRPGQTIKNPHDKRNYRLPILENKDDPIPLLALPDTAKANFGAFKEYKTSVKPWTQKKADESGQITFYSATIWLARGIVPEEQDIELVNVPVEYGEYGRLYPTGELIRFPTKRTMTDVLKMTARMRKAWSQIKELCENELL